MDSPFLVPAIGLEPIRLLGLRILSPVRLPIPPRGHKNIKFVLKCEFLTIRKILSPVRPSILRKSYCYEKQYNFIINPKKLQSNFKNHRNYSIII